MGAVGMLALVAASMIAASGGRPGLGWGVFCFLMFGLGFIYTWPPTLALCSRNAPAAVGGVIMGMAFLQGFIANSLAGWIGSQYETMSATQFWFLQAVISGAGGLLIFAFLRPINRALNAP